MDRETATKLASVLKAYAAESDDLEFISDEPTEGFSSAFDGVENLGHFAFTRESQRLAFSIHPRSLSRGEDFLIFLRHEGAFSMRISTVTNGQLTWQYKPTKRDGANAERVATFTQATGSDIVTLAIPTGTVEVEVFLTSVAAASTARLSADGDDGPRYFKISPGNGAKLWNRWRAEGIAEMGFREIGDLSNVTRGTLAHVINTAVSEHGITRFRARTPWRFRQIRMGDYVLANEGTTKVLGLGRVTSRYTFHQGEEYPHRIGVNWYDTDERAVEEYGWRSTMIQLDEIRFNKIAALGDTSSDDAQEGSKEEEGNVGIDFADLLAHLRGKPLFFNAETVANYLLALQAKRFVLLSGISGTGKTQLALEIAKQLGRQMRDGQQPDTYAVIAVQPDWTDRSGLLGFHNALTDRYTMTPFLRLVLRAHTEESAAKLEQRPAAPFFAILDEMNLARVEHYFADFLSALESGEPLQLHESEAVENGDTEDETAIPRSLSIPKNLFFTGTVNVDESTYMFSPKVLDRAFTIELNEVDLEAFAWSMTSTEEDDDMDDTPLALDQFTGHLGFKKSESAWRWFVMHRGGAMKKQLVALNRILAPTQHHFGYRVANEIARFVELALRQAGEHAIDAAFDLALLQKVLPKLHGSQGELGDLLDELFAFAAGHKTERISWSLGERGMLAAKSASASEAGGEGSETTQASIESKRQDLRFPRFAAKIYRMAAQLDRSGFTSFVG